MIRPFGGAKKTGSLADDVARARTNLADALGATEPDAFARALVREAWRLIPVRGLAWLTVSDAGLVVAGQAPRAVIHPNKLTGGVVQRALNSKRPVRAELKIDPALVENPASVLAVPMRWRGETVGLMIALRDIAEPFELSDENALDALLRAASEVQAQPAQAIQAAGMPPVALLRVDLFWAEVPTEVAREQSVQEAARIVRGSIRPTDDLRRADIAALEVTLKRPTPETVSIVSQRLHHMLASHIVALHGARWSIYPFDKPAG